MPKQVHSELLYRLCFVCSKAIEDIRKASYIPVGAGLRAPMHDQCANSLNAEINALAREGAGSKRKSMLEADMEAATGMNAGIGTARNGGEAGSGKVKHINRPCLACNEQVMDSTSIDIGGFTYAAHPGCKQTVLEGIAGALGAGALNDNHSASLIAGNDQTRTVE